MAAKTHKKHSDLKPKSAEDPVDYSQYPERPLEEARADAQSDQSHGITVYADPEHHAKGDMSTVEAAVDVDTGQVARKGASKGGKAGEGN